MWHGEAVSATIVWIVVAAACLIGEMLTGTFFLLALSLGAAAAAVGAALTDADAVPILLFAAGSAAFTIALIPVRRRLDRVPQPKVGANRLVGATAVVVNEVDDLDGLVRVQSEEWRARTSGPTLAAGDRAIVLSVEGTRLVVAEPDQAPT